MAGRSSEMSCQGCGRVGCWPRMFPAFYPSLEDRISPESSWTFQNSGMAWHGESETPNFSEFRSDEGGSLSSQRTSLADVLEPSVARKYYLSAKAAAGILRRAERRGKELPEALAQALSGLAASTVGHHGHSSPRGDGSDNIVVANPLGAHHGRNDLDHDTYLVAPTLTAGDLNPKWMGNNGGMDMLLGTLTARMQVALGARDVEEGAIQNMPDGVRRLTPLECERLQGFPDDWTRWGADGKEISDSHRYRMMGNAVAVPVIEWLGHRIMATEKAAEVSRG